MACTPNQGGDRIAEPNEAVDVWPSSFVFIFFPSFSPRLMPLERVVAASADVLVIHPKPYAFRRHRRLLGREDKRLRASCQEVDGRLASVQSSSQSDLGPCSRYLCKPRRCGTWEAGEAAERGVGLAAVVPAQPTGEGPSAIGEGAVSEDTGPAAQRGLDQLLGLAAGARRIGAGTPVLQAACLSVAADVAGTVWSSPAQSRCRVRRTGARRGAGRRPRARPRSEGGTSA